ncbi:hypothetical protein HY745_14010, partial [Candidatus Desantisbacteria bacterium]|nr:hypothetical protein [Candidatus Desantisbacteria bacterium]
MSTSSQIIKNVFSNWAYYFLQIVTSFFLMPFLVHSMGDAIYGIWTLILSTAGYMGLVNFEIRSAVIKYISEFRAKKEQEKINEITSTGFYSYTILGGIVLAITLIVANYFDRIFQIESAYAGETKIAFIFIGLNLAINLPFAAFGGLIWGYQKYDFNSGVEIGMLIARTALIVIFVKMGYGLVALSIITIIINIMGQIARVFYAYKLNPELVISYKLFKKETWKLISNYSLFAFLITIAAQLIYNTDNV